VVDIANRLVDGLTSTLQQQREDAARQLDMVRRDGDERLQLQQQAAEEKLHQAELLAEEKRQRTLLEFQLQQLQSTTTIQTTQSEIYVKNMKYIFVVREIPDKCMSGLAFIFKPDKSPKYRTVRLNTGQLATLSR